jgi:hypothetical protein
MNVANLDAFGNPRSADHQAAAKYASEMIDSIAAKKATQLLPISARMLLPKRQWSICCRNFRRCCLSISLMSKP